MKIIGTGSALPSLSVTNEMLSVFMDTSDEWIRTRTGILERRIISDENLKDLAVEAAKRALEEAKMDGSELDYIICSNVVNYYVTPSLSCLIAGEINASCPCVDLNAACSGFVYGLDMAQAYQMSGKAKNILVICAEEPTRMCSWKDRNTAVLFGDGAAAAVVTEGDDFKASYITARHRPEILYYQRPLEDCPFVKYQQRGVPMYMNGKEVFKMAVNASVEGIERILKETGLTADQVDHYILHQANMRIIETIRTQLHQPVGKFPHNIERLGNTSSATIPILLDELNKTGKLKNGDTIVLSGFGAGFTAGTCLFTWTMN
ncbi:MAG: beta-ketoacyl-ACP synthase III [Bacteroidales bacterium]|jgi:3-oxoacyl-[acyl-carrier-protein] synthase-3|nr:ketoacyl-ACP synthase III [Bacteroidales bacterium]MDD3101302.1 ketoacyl-ACP synthase III [Bacteroidales bacterium]MDD3639519.1 ketoacyl-ACP synthase III [Bacteroidales bacterium]MDD3944219.1 ketoacyl-ACP synthase III [Bacteroidales bacterium]MDD4481334.1 ketoacyl-ACP synthase III [Bacteroidales bacterium]